MPAAPDCRPDCAAGCTGELIDVNERGLLPEMVALVMLVRAECLTPTSAAILSAKSYMQSNLGKKHASIVQGVINAAADLVAYDVSCVEAWTCLVVACQAVLASVRVPESATAAEVYKLETQELRRRVTVFMRGDVASLWRTQVQRYALPTSRKWEKQQRRSAVAVRSDIGKAARAAIDQCDIKSGNMTMAATPAAPPGEREYALLCGLLPATTGVGCDVLRAAHTAMGLGDPTERARCLHERLSSATAIKENTSKWEPIIAGAKTRKQPCGTGWRTEFTKRLAEWNGRAWAIIFEAVEARAVPDEVRVLLTCPFVVQLLKRDANRRFSAMSKTRPIGLTCSLTQDALRPWAQRGSKVLACVLMQYGQMACGVKAGNEAAQTAAQVRCDLSKWTVTVAIDYANAFGLVENELTYLALKVVVRLIYTVPAIQSRLRDADIALHDAELAIQFMLEDLVWTRTTGFSCVTVVEGELRRLFPTVGETQGGLFSALRYVVAKAVAVDMWLSLEFPDHVMRSIVDDGIVQLDVRAPEHVDCLVAWMVRLSELVEGVNRPVYRDATGSYAVTGKLGRLNFGKFKVLQHPDARGTDYDVELACDRFPFELQDGKRKYPAVVRDVLDFNGVAVGFDVLARRAHILQEVRNLEERAARLMDVSTIMGRQRAEVYARASYRPSSVLMHQMRASPPSVAMEAMGHATQLQLRLYRHVTGASVEMLGGAMEEWEGVASPMAQACRCSLSLHLPSVMGGCNYPEPRLVQPYVHAAAKVDTYPTIAAMADMGDYPPPAAWLTCNVPSLREAAATIATVVAMRGFHVRPPGDAAAWERVQRILLDQHGQIVWDNVPKLAGQQFQRVLTRAAAFELMLRALRSPRVHQLTKVRLLAAAQPGAGEWCCLSGLPNQWVRLDDHAFQRGVFARVGHPDPQIGTQTRCVCSRYNWEALPRVPGPNVSLVERPEVSELEHRLGLHFHWCRIAGMSTQGHNEVSHAWLRALRKLGYAGEVYEVPIGVNDNGKQVRGDGIAKNFAVSATVMVWDARVSSSYLPATLKAAAEDMFVVTDRNEELKVKEKEPWCQRCLQGRVQFLPVVCNSHGGLGRRAYVWLTEAFQRKIDVAPTVAAKYAARLELDTALAELSCAVLRRNSMIMAANVRGAAGGGPATVTALFHDVQRGDVMHDGI